MCVEALDLSCDPGAFRNAVHNHQQTCTKSLGHSCNLLCKMARGKLSNHFSSG